MVLGAFMVLSLAFVLGAEKPDDGMAFVDFLALPVMVAAYALLRRSARAANVLLISLLAVTLPPTSIQRDVDSGGWFGRSGRGERRGLVRSLASSAAPDPVAG